MNDDAGNEAVPGSVPDVLPSGFHAEGGRWNWQNICRDLGYMPEQVQDFYPTPSTLSTCMYYTGL